MVPSDPSPLLNEDVELDLAPNGDEIKVRWKIRGPSWSKTLRIPAALLKKRSESVRFELDALNKYVSTNQGLDQARDPGWMSYSSAIQRLQEAGRGLAMALLPPDNADAQEKARTLRWLPTGTKLKVYCSDSQVSLPLGFIFDGTVCPPTTGPSLANFADFWLSRFEITMYVEGSGCDRLTIDPAAFKALYALHKTELGDAATFLGNDLHKLKRLLRLPVKEHYDWESARRAWEEIRNDDNIIFVLAHSDGDWLHLSNSRLDCLTFVDLLRKTELNTTLLILNCCLSVQGGEGASLLSAVARRGFCGLIGTESEILNTYALRCGTRLMWELCANGRTLGEAFDVMQRDTSLFPLNLFYTCYADREFRLERPLNSLTVN